MKIKKKLIVGGLAVVLTTLISVVFMTQVQDIEWYRTFGGKDWDIGCSVQQTVDGGYIVVGYTKSLGSSDYDVYLIKVDANGNLQWEKTYGGAGFDIGVSVQQTSDCGYIIVGYMGSFGSGGVDIYLIKIDSNGNILWQKTFGGSGYDRGFSVQQTTDGGFIIVGSTNSFGSGTDVYLIKTDSNGNLQWQKTLGGSAIDWGNFVQQTSDGGYIIVGYTKSFGLGETDVYLIKISRPTTLAMALLRRFISFITIIKPLLLTLQLGSNISTSWNKINT